MHCHWVSDSVQNVQDYWGQTPLALLVMQTALKYQDGGQAHGTISRRLVEVIIFLLESGADPLKVNARGESASTLGNALTHDALDLAAAVLRGGADLEAALPLRAVTIEDVALAPTAGDDVAAALAELADNSTEKAYAVEAPHSDAGAAHTNSGDGAEPGEVPQAEGSTQGGDQVQLEAAGSDVGVTGGDAENLSQPEDAEPQQAVGVDGVDVHVEEAEGEPAVASEGLGEAAGGEIESEPFQAGHGEDEKNGDAIA